MHETDVVDAPAEHRKPIKSHAEGEPLVPLRIDTRILEDIGMDHTGAHYLDPLIAQLFGNLLADEAHVDFDGWLGERKEARAESDLD